MNFIRACALFCHFWQNGKTKHSTKKWQNKAKKWQNKTNGNAVWAFDVEKKFVWRRVGHVAN